MRSGCFPVNIEAGANSRVNRDQRPLQRVLALDALKSVRYRFIIIGELKVTLLKIDVGRNGCLEACFLSQNATEAWVQAIGHVRRFAS